MIQRISEGRRGCGWRKSGGGLYLMADGVLAGCDRMPLPVGRCPTCGGGVKPSRGFTWIEPQKLWPPIQEIMAAGGLSPCQQNMTVCRRCPVAT